MNYTAKKEPSMTGTELAKKALKLMCLDNGVSVPKVEPKALAAAFDAALKKGAKFSTKDLEAFVNGDDDDQDRLRKLPGGERLDHELNNAFDRYVLE